MIELNWTFWVQLANFCVLMLVLNFLVYRPLRRVMEKRHQTLEDSRQRVGDLQAQIDEKMARYQAQLQQAKLQGSQEKVRLRQEAAQQEAAVLGEARQAAGDYLLSIRNRVEAEAREAGQALRTEANKLAVGISSKVLGRELS